MSCTFAGTDRPRVITGRHTEDCADQHDSDEHGCRGCQPCVECAEAAGNGAVAASRVEVAPVNHSGVIRPSDRRNEGDQ